MIMFTDRFFFPECSQDQDQMPDGQTVSHSQSLIRKIVFIF